MDARIREAFGAVPRELFLPPDQRRHAGADRPLPIGHGVTNSQPTTVANMLALLDPQPGDRVLDVGCGSGWTTALIAHLVGATGQVVGVELIPEVLEQARANLADRRAVELHVAESGALGWPAGAPYDRILVSADAAGMPTALVEQLAPTGVLVGPVHGEMLRIIRSPEHPVVERHGRYSFVPLIED